MPKKTTFIRDTVHKNINISEPVINELIECPEFQRLRWISQLSGAQIAFPGATHNRFTHSIGVFHIISRVVNEAENNHLLNNEDKLLVKIAGLLHDIGHGPFSHTFEKIANFDDQTNFKFSHEWYTCAIISDKKSTIYQVLQKYQINIAKIISIIEKDQKHCMPFQIALVSSQIDCDRMDYLLRDAYFTGIDYGMIDLDWIISNMMIDLKYGIIFKAKAVAAIENYLITRFHMYLQVYYHWSSLSFDWKWQKLFQRIKQINAIKPQNIFNHQWIKAILQHSSIPIIDYLALNDAKMLSLLDDIMKFSTDSDLIELAKELLFSQKIRAIEIKPISYESKQQSKTKVLKSVIYDGSNSPIMILMPNQEIVNIEKISQILKNTNDMFYFLGEIK